MDKAIVITGPLIPIYTMLVVKSALSMYVRFGIKANTAYTPANMQAFVTRITGVKYKRGQCAIALKDLTAHLEALRPQSSPAGDDGGADASAD